MAPVETEHMSITVESGNYELKASGYTVLFKGFTELYEEQKEKGSQELPPIHEATIVHNKKVEKVQHFTQPSGSLYGSQSD